MQTEKIILPKDMNGNGLSGNGFGGNGMNGNGFNIEENINRLLNDIDFKSLEEELYNKEGEG